METYKEPTPNMKAALLDLLTVVTEYDGGKAGLPHDVVSVHHMTLKAMAKPAYGCLILLDVSNSPTGIVWTVAITRYGLKVAKQLAKQKIRNNDTNINTLGKKKAAPRQLRTLQWQLDVAKDNESKLYEDAKAMKEDKHQSFTRTMNQLMALHKELKAGQVGLLQALYPEAYATMLLIARNELEMENNGELRGLLDEFKRHVLSTPQAANNGANFVLPTGDEQIDLNVQKDANAGKEANTNFLRSMNALNPITEPAPTGIRQLAVKAIEVPVYDDDDDDLFG